MAYLVHRGTRDARTNGRQGRVEIRESRSTPQGPRSRVLASFTGPLTPEILDRAAARAARPFDRAALVRRARAAGIAVRGPGGEPEARALLARLRRDDPLDPALAAALRAALARQPDADVPEALAEVSEWVGASVEERGAALRELLDLSDRIARSRTLPRRRERKRFPRFSSLRPTG